METESCSRFVHWLCQRFHSSRNDGSKNLKRIWLGVRQGFRGGNLLGFGHDDLLPSVHGEEHKLLKLCRRLSGALSSRRRTSAVRGKPHINHCACENARALIRCRVVRTTRISAWRRQDRFRGARFWNVSAAIQARPLRATGWMAGFHPNR